MKCTEVIGWENGNAIFCDKPAFRCNCGEYVCAEHYKSKHNGGKIAAAGRIFRKVELHIES